MKQHRMLGSTPKKVCSSAAFVCGALLRLTWHVSVDWSPYPSCSNKIPIGIMLTQCWV